ncbi:unnamed protein product [Rhodiola kirilowii]
MASAIQKAAKSVALHLMVGAMARPTSQKAISTILIIVIASGLVQNCKAGKCWKSWIKDGMKCLVAFAPVPGRYAEIAKYAFEGLFGKVGMECCGDG